MSIKNAYHRKDGRWEVRTYLGKDEKGKRKFRSFYGKTKEEAENRAACKPILMPNVPEQPLTEMTVKELTLEFLHRKAPQIKESTISNYMMKTEKHIIPALGDKRCSEITANDIYRFMDKMRKEQLSERYIYDNVVLLKSIFRYGHITYRIKNVTDGIVMPKKTKPEVVILNAFEQQKLKSYISDNLNLVTLGLAVAMCTGIRIGELCALQWQDIDLEKRILTVRKTIQRIQVKGAEKKTKLVITEPKSQSSVRCIPIPNCLCDMLELFKGESTAYILSGTDKPVEPRTMQNRFAKILVKAGLPSVHFHSLRHAFATNCIAKGFDVKTLSEILGHSSVEITLNRYVHSSLERKKEFMDTLTWDSKKASA